VWYLQIVITEGLSVIFANKKSYQKAVGLYTRLTDLPDAVMKVRKCETIFIIRLIILL
jgi:hypothetical protein